MIAVASRPNSSRRSFLDHSDCDHTSHRIDAVTDEPRAATLTADTSVGRAETRKGPSRFLTVLLRALAMPGA